MKCHFVYSVPLQNKSLIHRIGRKVRIVLNKAFIPVGLITNRQPDEKDLNQWPIKSPYANTKNIYKALSKIYPTYLYDLRERAKIRFNNEDIFIGHPFFPYKPDGIGVTELAVSSKFKPRVLAIITPLHCDINIITTHINKAFLDHVNSLIPHVDILFAIMGEYWWDQWDLSPYSHWKSKMVRLDMAIDAQRYPRIKKSFNSAGKRGYLYIGNSRDPRKGVDFLSRLMNQFNNYPKGWIGSGPDIPNVPRISYNRPLTPEFMAEIAKQYDFFISPAKADPNPTTILESMAWGFPVVCTPQSGYYETDYRKNIYLEDIVKSTNVLEELQYADEQILMVIADKAREIVVADYSWDNLTSTVIQNLGI